jgi:histidine triad (HIT) family protein
MIVDPVSATERNDSWTPRLRPDRSASANGALRRGTIRAVTEQECLFCKIVSGDVPATVVRETATTLAFRDINPQAPTHVLVIPKSHHADVNALARTNSGVLTDLMHEAHQVAVDDDVADSGYRIVFNTGSDGGQTVYHVHAHVLGGRVLTWPPG